MHSVGWLHFTDLHLGAGGAQRWIWPQVEDDFLRDLEHLHRRSGPWDLVFFTGDLTQRGGPEEFARLDETLDRLWALFRRLGSDPVLVTVPGNHDLRRPPQTTPVLRALRHWHADEELREEFWTRPDSPYRAVVDEAFAPYRAWHGAWRARHPLPDGVSETPGLLPGDHVLTYARHGVRLGIAGLNSSFLQLSAGDYMGRLDVDVRQLLDGTHGSPGAWARGHQLALLLTHHPPEWLHARAQAHYRSHLTPQDRFALHLFGHMHEPTAVSMKIGGAPTRRSIQGASLFGLEGWGEEAEQARIHGYSAGRFEIRSDAAHLRVWPRLMRRHVDAGHFRLVPDFEHFDLDPESLSWTDAAIPVRDEALPGESSPPPEVRGLRPPGAPYHPDWYVARPKQELQALTALRSPGVPAVVLGADLGGTSFFVRHVGRVYADEVQAAGGRLRVVDADLGHWGEATPDDTEALFTALAELLHETATDRARAEQAWQRAGNLEWRLTNLMKRLLDEDAGGQVLLVVERADAVVGRAAEGPFFRMLRSWAESAYKAPWPRLRILVALSTAPLFLRDTVVTSPFFNRVSSVHLRDFELDQVRSMARLLGVGWPDADLGRLMGHVGGHPYLVHTALFHAALGEPSDRLLDPVHLEDDVFRQHLGQRWLWIQRDGRLVEAIRSLVRTPDGPIDAATYERLRMAGLVARDGQGARMRNALYERYFRQLLGTS